MPRQEHRIIAKFFGGSSYSFYATEYHPETQIFFGLVTGLDYPELGYVSLEDMENVTFQFGLKIERDLWFGNKTKLSEVRQLVG